MRTASQAPSKSTVLQLGDFNIIQIEYKHPSFFLPIDFSPKDLKTDIRLFSTIG